MPATTPSIQNAKPVLSEWRLASFRADSAAAVQHRDPERMAPMPPNRLATSGGQRRRCSTVPRFPADAAVIVAGRTCGASVLRPRRRSAEQRLASLESNGAQCILQCLTMAIKLRHVFSRRPLTEITPLSGNTSPPCIQNELVLARFARRVSK